VGEPIFITGAGIISAIGNNKKEVLDSLLNERSGIAPLKYLKTDHKEFPVGEVKLSNEQMVSLLDIDENQPVTRTALMGMLALKEALAEAEISCDMLGNIAFISGTTVGGMDMSEQFYADFLSNNSKNTYIATHDCGASSQMIADHFGTFESMTTISTACSSAANAIILGADLIRSGRNDIVVVGGSECITKFHLNGFNSLMILDREICRPFDSTRAGLNLGEGAAYIVMESGRSFNRRRGLIPGLKAMAVLRGYSNRCDAYHQTASSDNGEGRILL
jgi:3-oxoacyl-(acyl-carrier-protein) synthase